jgi:hypothetical protein
MLAQAIFHGFWPALTGGHVARSVLDRTTARRRDHLSSMTPA